MHILPLPCEGIEPVSDGSWVQGTVKRKQPTITTTRNNKDTTCNNKDLEIRDTRIILIILVRMT